MRSMIAALLILAALLSANTGAALAGRGDGSDAPALESKISTSAAAGSGSALPVRDADIARTPAGDADNKRNLLR